MKLPCAVVRDLLPLYAEKMTAPETQALIREHLSECSECRRRLSETETVNGAPIETAKPLKALKKEIRKRRWYAVLVAALLVFVAVFTYFFRANAPRLVPWEEGLITVKGVETVTPTERLGRSYLQEPDTAPQEALILLTESRITGIREHRFTDEDGATTVVLQGMGWNPPRESGAAIYNEYVLYPAPDRLIYGDGQTQKLLWGEPMNGGVEVLPRLALSFYLLAAAALALLFGLLWLLLRNRDHSWICRQLFFAPVSYIAAHFLIMGSRTSSFFLERNLFSVLLIAAALYALLSLAWQIWLQRKRAL